MDFNIEAINWDNDRRIKRSKIIADEIIKSIPINKDYRALEFGCGTGLISFNLKDKFGHITLIDTSEGMVKKLNSKILDLKVRNMAAINMDINGNNELKGQKFNVVYTSMVLHHIIDTRTTLKNLHDLILDNGYLCIIELTEDDGNFHRAEADFKGHNGFNQNELKELLEYVGFSNIVTSIFYNDSKKIERSEINYSLFIMTAEKLVQQ